MSVFQSASQILGHVPLYLAAVVLLALTLRLIVVCFAVPEVAENTFDHNAFGWEMGWTARSIFLGQGFSSPFLPTGTGPTALVPPVFPYLLAGVFRVFGLYTRQSAFAILAFNSICSALTCVPLYFLVRNTLTERLARIAAFAWAIYPFSVYFSADRVWDYALTILLFTCCLLYAQKLHLRGSLAWAGFGALYAVTVLSNPSVLTLLPLLMLIALFKVRAVGGRWIVKGVLTTLTFFAICAPWNLRNNRELHTHFFIRDGFWLEFYAGNNGDTRESNSAWAHPASNAGEMQKYKRLGEIQYIAEKHDLAVRFMHQRPGFIVVATVRRIIRFWTGYWSFSRSYLRYEPLDVPNVPFSIFLFVMMVRGVRRWWREFDGAVLPYLAAILIFPVPYYLTHSSTDYRQPIEPIVIILVTIGLFGTGRQESFPESDAVRQLDRETEAAVA